MKSRVVIALATSAGLTLTSCEYVWFLRHSVLKQLNPRVVRLVNELPEVDQPNEAIIAQLFAHGGLSHARKASDSVFRDGIYVPYVWALNAATGEMLWQYKHSIPLDTPLCCGNVNRGVAVAKGPSTSPPRTDISWPSTRGTVKKYGRRSSSMCARVRARPPRRWW